ncbi:HEAT repeat [Halomicrobium zhouii]|uniref:HEAT repeat n=1 Tax=Halomicrobium zhouii TaxID=767519 RepID=A0A1I6LZF5_9EURY|nr:HEAT repeat domain-containing protein [Halomicrobium zhouii]SFS08826.1 HEAT repeat [Halomicrobium zhouii]
MSTTNELVRGLRDPDPRRRRDAIDALVEQDAARAVGPLSALVERESDTTVTAAALRAIGRLGAEGEGVPTLLDHLDDENGAIRRAARDGLRSLDGVAGASTVERLLDALAEATPADDGADAADRGSGPDDAAAIAAAIGAIDDPSALPAVRTAQYEDDDVAAALADVSIAAAELVREDVTLTDRAALSAPDPFLRRDAVRAHAEAHGSEARAPIEARLDDDHPAVRVAAAEALGSIGDPRSLPTLCRHLVDERDDVFDAIDEAVDDVTGPRRIQRLCWVVETAPRDSAIAAEALLERRMGLIASLGLESRASARESIREVAIEMVETDVTSERAEGLSLLAVYGTADDVGRCVDALSAADPVIREQAALALGHLGVDHGRLVRSVAGRRLPLTGAAVSLDAPGERVQPLRDRLDVETDDDVVAQLLDSLGVLGEASVLQAVVDRLTHRDPVVRERAAFAVAKLGDCDTLPAVRSAFDVESAPRARAAQVAAMGALYEADCPAVGDVRAVLETAAVEDEAATVRRWATIGLGYVGDSSAAETIRAVHATDPSPLVTTAADSALARIARRNSRLLRAADRVIGATADATDRVIRFGLEHERILSRAWSAVAVSLGLVWRLFAFVINGILGWLLILLVLSVGFLVLDFLLGLL